MDCPACGYALTAFEKECPRCRRFAAEAFAKSPASTWPPAIGAQPESVAVSAPPLLAPTPVVPPVFDEDNSSGEGRGVPAEIAALRWNWGAFFFGWLWCLFQRMPGFALAILGVAAVQVVLNALFLRPYGDALPGDFMGVVGFGLNCYLAINGHTWAWERRRFPGGVAEFRAVQRAWTIAGVVECVLVVILASVMNSVIRVNQQLAAQKLAASAPVPSRPMSPPLLPAPVMLPQQTPQRPIIIYTQPVPPEQRFPPQDGFNQRTFPNNQFGQPPVHYVPLPGGGFRVEPNAPSGDFVPGGTVPEGTPAPSDGTPNMGSGASPNNVSDPGTSPATQGMSQPPPNTASSPVSPFQSSGNTAP